MKNVAATNGQSVSFAALFLGVESTWEGIWAGTDMLLNSYVRPPKRNLFSLSSRLVKAKPEQMRREMIQGLHPRATKNCILQTDFLLPVVPVNSRCLSARLAFSCDKLRLLLHLSKTLWSANS